MEYKNTVHTFAGGELSPDLHSRTDIQQYPASAKAIENFVISPTGSAYRRPSTKIVTELDNTVRTDRRIHRVKTDTVDAILIFEVSVPFSGTLAAYMAGVCVYDFNTDTITPVTDLRDPSNTLSKVMNRDTSKLLRIQNLRMVQVGIDTIVWDSTGDTPPFRITIGRDGFDVSTFYYTCDLYTLPTSAPSIEQGKSLVKAHPIAGSSGQGYGSIPNVAFYVDVDTGSSTGIFINPVSVELKATNAIPTDVNLIGHVIYINTPSQRECVYVVVAQVNATTLTGYLLTSANEIEGVGNARTNYKISAWGNYYGYPQAGGIYQGRFHFACTKIEALNYWASDLFDPRFYMNTRLVQDLTGTDISGLARHEDLAAYGFSKVVVTTGLSKITSLGTNAEYLFVGTTTGDYQVRFASGNALGYVRDTALIEARSDKASSNAIPVYADGKLLYLSSDRRAVRALNILSDADQYININVSTLSNTMYKHSYTDDVIPAVADSRIVFMESAYLDRSSVVFIRTGAVDSNAVGGGLVSFTIDDTAGITAWTKHRIHSAKGVPVPVISITDNRSTDTSSLDSITLLVEDGDTQYILELGSDRHQTTEPLLDFMHLGLTNGSSANFFSPFLANKECTLVVEDSETGEVTEFPEIDADADGNFILPIEVSAASTCWAGIPYKSRIETHTISDGSRFGDARGDVQRIDRATISLYNSKGGLCGSAGESLNDIEYEDPSSFYTGDVTVDVSQSSDRETRFVIENETAQAMTVVSLTFRGES